MRSLWGRAPFQVEVRNVPVPVAGPGEVIVRVTACGICGTDLHFLRFNTEWTPLGHEVVGVIAEVGPGVERWRGGEPVIVENHTGCGVCEQCKNGRALYCRDMTTYMDDRAGLADFLRVRADMVQAYDAGALTPQQAALAEPLTVALDLLQRASHAIPNHYFPMALDLLARGVIDTGLLTTHAFALDDFAQAFRAPTDPEQPAVKVIVMP
jgi:L-iditol 2-dehydrogenase